MAKACGKDRQQQWCVGVAGVIGDEDGGRLDQFQLLRTPNGRGGKHVCKRSGDVVDHDRS
jgi:hypothetical protein